MWKIKDFVDLEYFFYLDRNENEETLIKRDRLLYLEKISNEDNSKGDKIKKWLEIRQCDNDNPEELPGQVYENSYLLLKNILIIIGLLSGWTLTNNLLWYDGTTPINVSSFFFILIVFQIALLVFLILVVLFRNKLRSLTIISPIITKLLRKIAVFIFKKIYDKIPSQKLRNFESKMGFIKSQKLIYGNLFKWQTFNITQIFAIFFNLAILLTLLFKIFTADLALGWQSTAEIQTTVIHQTVETLAIPWSSFVAENAYPSLEEIEGSRIILKDGIYFLKNEHLTSWWPFLCLSILFYGLIPRILLFLIGLFGQKQSIKRFHFNHANCNKLLRRFETTYLSMDENPEQIKNSVNKIKTQKSKNQKTLSKNTSYQVIVKESIGRMFSNEHLEKEVEKKLTYKTNIFYIENSLDGEDKAIEHLENQDFDGIILLQASWKPPIGESVEFIEELREIAKEKEIIVALLGKPSDEKQAQITINDYNMWFQAIEKLGDSFSSISCLGEKSE